MHGSYVKRKRTEFAIPGQKTLTSTFKKPRDRFGSDHIMSMRVRFSDMGAMWFVVSVVIVDGASRAWLFYVTRTTQSQRQVCVVVERQNVRPHCRGFN